jgi:hypothetical protein
MEILYIRISSWDGSCCTCTHLQKSLALLKSAYYYKTAQQIYLHAGGNRVMLLYIYIYISKYIDICT